MKSALSVLLGENPSEEKETDYKKIADIIQLDDLLQEQERKETENIAKNLTINESVPALENVLSNILVLQNSEKNKSSLNEIPMI